MDAIATLKPLFAWLTLYKEAIATLLAIGGSVWALVTFARGVREYRRAESWKRTQFLSQLYKNFWDDPACRRAIMMLDGTEREICFDGAEGQKCYRTFKPECLREALRKGDSFTAFEFHIRDSLDRFFIYLEQFERLIATGLVSKDEVYPYFAYWIDQLNGKKDGLDPAVCERVREYLWNCHFDNVNNFLARWAPAEKVADG